MKLAILFAIFSCVASRPVDHGGRRDLFGFLAGEETVSGPLGSPVPVPTTPQSATTTNALGANILSVPPTHHRPSNPPLSISLTKGASESLARSHTAEAKAQGSSVISHSATSSPSIPSDTAEEDELATPPGELTQWKIIGISIICVTFIAVVVLLITFFDNWWRFVKDVFGISKKGGGSETFLTPDWKRRTWEAKLAGEDGHRYPTMTSVDSPAKSSGDFWVGMDAGKQGMTSPIVGFLFAFAKP